MDTKDLKGEARKSSWLVYIASFCAQLGAICGGSAMGWTAPAFPDMDRDTSEPHLTNSDEDRDIKSWIASSLTLGALSGGLICGFMLNIIGRKNSLIITGVMFTIGWGFIFFAKSVAMIIAGRFVTGICCGLMGPLIPTYTNEISTPDNRGLLGSGFNLFITIGILLMSTSGLFVSWTYLALFAAIPGALMSVLMLLMPESPVWLILKYDNCDKVERVMKQLRHSSSNIDKEISELEEIAKRAKDKENLSIRQVYKPDVYKPLLISICLIFFLQFSGINPVLFYATDIFRDSGSALPSNISVIIINLTMVLATIPVSLLIDRLGRKILLIISSLGQAISLGLLGTYYYYYAKSFHSQPLQTITTATTLANETALLSFNTTLIPNLIDSSHSSSLDDNSLMQMWNWSPVVCLALYVFSFTIGYGTIPWIVISEISPSFAIGFITSVATVMNGLLAFYITNQFKTMNEFATKHGTFWFLAAVNVMSVVFNALYLPETKGKSLQQMQKYFDRNYSVKQKMRNAAVISNHDCKQQQLQHCYDNNAFTRL